MIEGIVLMNDPTSEDEDLSGIVEVILDNGFKVAFWQLGLSEYEYIKRANEIYNLENN